MGWLDGSRVAKQLESVPSGSQGFMQISASGGSVPNLNGIVEPDGSFQTFARNAYSRNELVYACISLRAESLAQSALRVYPSGMSNEPLDDHRLRRLIEQPNELLSEFEMFELSSTYLDLAGITYLLVVRGRDRQPAELWPLRPDLVGVLPLGGSPNRFDWVFRPDPERPQIQVRIPRDDIIRVRYPNLNVSDPRDRYFGQPPLRSAARATSLDNAATDFVDRLMRTDATPTSVVTTTETVTDALVERLRSKWFSRFGQGRGGPAFLQKGMDVKALGLNLRDLEFPDLRTISESRICMAMGRTPPILVGAKVGLDRSTFANYREAVTSWWHGPLRSLQRRFRDPMRQALVPQFTGVGRRPVTLTWDNSEVPALKEAEAERWERATNALARGGITRNDYRRTIGLPPVPNGDVFLTPAGVISEQAGIAGELESVASSMSLLAAEFGVELTDSERIALQARTGVEE